MTRFVLSLAVAVTSVGIGLLGCGPDTSSSGASTSSGSSTSSGGYTPPPSIPVENMSLEFSKAVCSKFFRCCNMAELTEFLSKFTPQPTTEAECVTALTPAAEKEPFGYLADRIMAGAVAYDATKAGACFGAIAADCSEFTDGWYNQTPACQGVYTGKIADGGDCTAGIECAGAGAVCNGTLQSGTGKCGPLPKENEACPDFECAAGLACFSDAMGQICKKPLADGQMCASSAECTSGFCDSTAMTCAQKKPDGSACMSYEECVSNECDLMNKCAPPAPPLCDGK